jgi:hypothetical protein
MAELVVSREYEFELPANAHIYQLRTPDASRDNLIRIASHLSIRAGLDVGSFTEHARWNSYQEPAGWTVRIFRSSGGWQYRHSLRWQADLAGANVSIDDNDAQQLAAEALAQFSGDIATGSEVQWVEHLHVNHAERGSAESNERTIGARVRFRRILDNIPVEGTGGSTVVYFDHAREVTGIDHLWREIDSVAARVTSLRRVGDALDDVGQRYRASRGRFEVTDVRFGYFELGWYDEQEYLQPAYIVFLRSGSPESKSRMRSVVAVPAAENHIGEVQPEPRRRDSQPVRT